VLQLEHEPLTVEQARNLNRGDFLFTIRRIRVGLGTGSSVRFVCFDGKYQLVTIMGPNGDTPEIRIDNLRLPYEGEIGYLEIAHWHHYLDNLITFHRDRTKYFTEEKDSLPPIPRIK